MCSNSPTAYVLGIDEAGRGSVIGPMVIAGVLIDPAQLHALSNIVTKNSKKYTHRRRLELYPSIRNFSTRIVLKVVDPHTIDQWVIEEKGLNKLEAFYIASIIGELLNEGYRLSRIIVDSCDVNSSRFKSYIASYLPSAELIVDKIICEHKADERYSVVAAASVVAKVVREEKVEELRKLYGDFGSGYPSDARTISYLRENIGKARSIVRRSWRTVKELIS